MSLALSHKIYKQLKLVVRWQNRLLERVWGSSHDLSEDAMDMDDRVDDTIRYGSWDQLHSITDKSVAHYTVVD